MAIHSIVASTVKAITAAAGVAALIVATPAVSNAAPVIVTIDAPYLYEIDNLTVGDPYYLNFSLSSEWLIGIGDADIGSVGCIGFSLVPTNCYMTATSHLAPFDTWLPVSYAFVATAPEMTAYFSTYELVGSVTVGVDDISVSSGIPAPEPSSGLILLTGLLCAARRARQVRAPRASVRWLPRLARSVRCKSASA